MDDLERLLQLEAECVDSDRLSRRSYRALLKRASATVLLAEHGDVLVGALVLLFKRGSAIAHLYSLAVSREARAGGIGGTLLRAAEQTAFERDCAVLRLEVRADNTTARQLYESEGFVEIARIPRYFANGARTVRPERVAERMLKRSGIILLQDFIRTDFDCRSGVGEPLFAARYFVCDKRWQILKHAPDGSHGVAIRRAH